MNLSEKNIKAFFALLIIGSVIAGFFLGLIAPEVFIGIASSIITYYYKDVEANKLQEQIDSKDLQLQSIRGEITPLDR